MPGAVRSAIRHPHRRTLLADLTIVAAGLHTASAVRRFAPTLRETGRRGGRSAGDPRDPEPLAAVWFTACGVALAGLGLLGREVVAETGHLPRTFGPTLLAIAVPVCLLQPRTGAWILLPLGLAACRADHGLAPWPADPSDRS